MSVPAIPAFRALAAACFFTGFTALAAEVILGRLMRYVFGSGHEATATVLAAYMCGLSLGALGFGALTSRLRRPVIAYALLELAVALFYAAAPALFQGFRGLAVAAAGAFPEGGPGLLALRFGLSFGFVLIPTVFMGGTLPVLISAFRAGDALSHRLPALYAANTLGAAAGSLASGYFLIPLLGLDGTLALAALVNVAAAVVAVALAPRLERSPRVQAASPEAGPTVAAGAFGPTPIAILAAAQGVVVFVLEVVWTHLVGTVIGVTVYAFATMLTAILLGIGLGSAAIPLLRRWGLQPTGMFVVAETGLGTAVLLTLGLWDRFPEVINLSLDVTAYWPFEAREAVRFAFSLALLLPATVAMGIAFPSLVAAVRGPLPGSGAGRFLGTVFAANTAGAVAGSLLCGFALLGWLPAATILRAAALAAVGLALVALAAAPRLERRARTTVFTLLAAGLLSVAFVPSWSQSRLTAGNHYVWDRWPNPAAPSEVVFFAEDAQVGFVTVDRRSTGRLVLKTNGKYESSDDPFEFQDYFALLGGLYTRAFDRVFLLGLGTGRTLALLHEMPFERLDVAEFSPAIVAAARARFSGFVETPLADPRVRLRVDDGRNVLQLSRGGYDVVIVGITGAAFAGSGSLYSRDFFELVRARLKPRGVLLMWMQLHHVEQRVVGSTLRTLREVFPHIHFYAVPAATQGYLIASAEPLQIDRRLAELAGAGQRARSVLSRAGLGSLEELVAWNVFSDDGEIRAYIAQGPSMTYTDFRPAFEYQTPIGLSLPIARHDLQPWSRGALPAFEPPLQAGEALGLLGLRSIAMGDLGSALARLEESERQLGQPRWSRQIEALRSGRPPVPES